MKIRPKTIRRLLLLAAVSSASAAIVGTVFIARRHAYEVALANARAIGMGAVESGDVARAIAPLTLYVAARPDDVDAIYALACADFAVETPGRDNLFEARSRLQQVLARQPDHLPAKRELMKIYERTHVPRELLTLADEVLAAVPTDLEASRCRAVALTELERDAEALPAWSAYLALAPTDFVAQSQLLTAMKRTGHTPDELVAYARSNVDSAPADPRFLLPLAAALREAGRDGEARTLLENLAAKPQTDAKFVVELAAALDRGRSFDAAESLLARSAEALGSSSLSAALVERMWQSGRYAQVITATESSLAPKSGHRDANVLAMRALSLAALGRKPDAASLAGEIESIRGDDEALAWSTALALEFATTPLPPAERVRQLRDALTHDTDNGILYDWLGRALRAAGEPEQASRCFREASQRMPSWATPCVELADAMLESGRLSEAAIAAKAGYLRAPTNLAVQLQITRVRFAELNDKASDADLVELLARVDDLSKILPSEPALPAMRVSLLARRGDRDQADNAVRAALATLPSGTSREPLYAAARRAGLSSASLVFDRALADGIITPRFAIERANELSSTPDGAAAALTWIKAQTAVHRGDVVWSLAEARVRQALHDSGAADFWRALVSANPTDLQVQSAALAEAGNLLTARPEQAAIVERLKLIAGEDSSAYRIARARWLAASVDDAEVRQALTLAADLVRQQPGRIEIRLLLARVLIRLDSAATAIEHLRAAHDQAPTNADVAFEYASALRQAGRTSEALNVLRAQAAFEVDDSATRQTLARALVDAGAFSEAISLLRRARENGSANVDEQLLLGDALDASGEDAGAAEAFAAVLGDTAATPASLAHVAVFERQHGHADQAAAILDRIERSADADDRSRALACYAITFGDVGTAEANYHAAIQSGHAGVDLMLEAIDFECGRRDFPAASAIASQALQRFPDEPRVSRAMIEMTVLRTRAEGSNASPALDALIAAMNADPNARRETAALRALKESQATGRPTAELAMRLAALADADPQSLELSRQAIGAALATGQPQLAGTIARRLLAERSGRVDALEIAAQALLQLHDLPAARRAAERWRAMVNADPRAADLTLAQIALDDGSAPRALATLEPYRATMTFNGDAALATTFAEALAQSGRATEAFELLDPPLTNSAAARSTWLHIASIADPADTHIDQRLGRLAAATPPDATAEFVRLAGVHLSRAENGIGENAAERGLALLTPLEQTGRLSGNARALLAELQRASGAAQTARATLRDALRVEPDNATVKNSLAYALLATPDGTAEAVRLATDAVAAAPSEASFSDTLARTLVASGDLPKAEAAFRVALRVDPGCLDAWLGLADLQARLGRPAEARASMASFEALLAKRTPSQAPVHLREQLRTVRQSVASTRE